MKFPRQDGSTSDYDSPDTSQSTNNHQATVVQDESSRLSPNDQGERSSEQESEEADEPGLRIPRLNSQGKVKTFRCKQCNFVAITKLEFWDHSRNHIKAEKLLTCPKCPFVTEYKHHLEYHLRNHFGSKPFKCEKCSYSCVNKSMLNSHLKSHSNVYQYRCANCTYATKYCHSLKLHLRKYSHQPAMVLNADGSPNPLPIIDVYGTRRGPKQKPSSKPMNATNGDEEMNNQNNNNNNNSSNNNNNIAASNGQIQIASPQQVAPPQMSPTPSNHVGLPLCATKNGTSGNAVTSNSTAIASTSSGITHNQAVITYPYNQLFTGFALSQLSSTTIAEDNDNQLDRIKANTLMDYLRAIDEERMSAEMAQDLVVRCPNGNGEVSNGVNGTSDSGASSMTEISMEPNPVDHVNVYMDSRVTPLDLSKPDCSANGKPSGNSPKVTGTSRRKGKAVKLERRVLEEDTDDEQPHTSTQQQYQQQQQHQQQQQLQQQQQQQLLQQQQWQHLVEQLYSQTQPHLQQHQLLQLHQQLQQLQQLQLQQLQQHQLQHRASMESDGSFESSSSSSPSSGEGKDETERNIAINHELTCHFCEIVFGNVIMYTVHMGYHGFQDPYTCNMCGHQCSDKVSFFLHIARSKHS